MNTTNPKRAKGFPGSEISNKINKYSYKGEEIGLILINKQMYA